MANKHDLKRLYLAARDGNSFSRQYLKDNFGFCDKDFSVLKKKGLLLETEKKIYSVPKHLVLNTRREELQSSLFDAIEKKNFEETLDLLCMLFELQDREMQVHYNYLLFLISHIIDLSDPWRSIALTFSLEEIKPTDESAVNQVRDFAYRGEFLVALILLNSQLRSGGCCTTFDKFSKILLDQCLKRQINENKVLLEYVSHNNYEYVKEFISSVKDKRLLTNQEKTIELYIEIILASKKFSVAPKELRMAAETEEELQIAGRFANIIAIKRRNLKFKRHIKNYDVSDILLIKIKRMQESMSMEVNKREMCVVPMRFLYKVLEALDQGDVDAAHETLEEFFREFGGESQIEDVVKTLNKSLQSGDYTTVCELFDEIYLKHVKRKSEDNFAI